MQTLSILVAGITLALAFGMLMILLWSNVRKLLNQFFAVFLLMTLLWNAGSLLTQAALLIGAEPVLLQGAIVVTQLGFTGSSVGIFALTTVVVGAQTRSFRVLAFVSLVFMLLYSAALGLGSLDLGSVPPTAPLSFQLQPLLVAFYLIFDGTTLFLVWRNRRKFQSQELITGIAAFVLGQSLSFLNPELEAFSVATIVCSVAALILSFALLKQEIITPLNERASQVEAVHRVSLAITSQINLETVLNEIAMQAAKWLRAEAVGIWLYRDGRLELTTVYNLPARFVHQQLALGQGVIGTVAKSRQSMHLADYRRDWQGVQDLPLARETFGSIIATPLTYRQEMIGVLLVVAARDGRTFDRDDVFQLDLLGAQAAVAIANSHLFEEQMALAQQVDFSRSQMETVLSSTQSAVIAVSRRFEIIFSNRAAQALFDFPNGRLNMQVDGRLLVKDSVRDILRAIRRNGHYVFELSLASKEYLCTVTEMKTGGERGFVAVLNDVTQLKELDRMKNEMVRMTSHDLKNPLQAALANVDLAKDELGDNPNPEVAESLDVIEHQLLRMNRIIRGILDVERARTGAYNYSPVEIGGLLGEAVDELRHLTDGGQAKFRIDLEPGLPQVLGDTEQLKRAIVNLLENAFKFTPEHGAITLRANATSYGVQIAVSDNGVGIPPEVGERVFERFYRVNQSGTEHISGSGLGLSLVKTIVEQHRGRVWFRSTPNVETTFTIELPRLSTTNPVS